MAGGAEEDGLLVELQAARATSEQDAMTDLTSDFNGSLRGWASISCAGGTVMLSGECFCFISSRLSLSCHCTFPWLYLQGLGCAYRSMTFGTLKKRPSDSGAAAVTARRSSDGRTSSARSAAPVRSPDWPITSPTCAIGSTPVVSTSFNCAM